MKPDAKVLAAFLLSAACAVSPAWPAHSRTKAPPQLTAPAPQSQDGWSEVVIKGFFMQEPSTWTDNCTSKLDQRFTHSEAMVNKTAQWNEELSCIKFIYDGTPIYVRSSAIDHTGAHTATISACDRDIASAQSSRSKTGSTMGMGSQQKCSN